MENADQLLKHYMYLSEVERDLGTSGTTNAQLDGYMTRKLGPNLFHGVYDVSGYPMHRHGAFCYMLLYIIFCYASGQGLACGRCAQSHPCQGR
eukprot:COSAG02_NODE_7039_length_3214_cov_14.690851_2_plen_93_part_00